MCFYSCCRMKWSWKCCCASFMSTPTLYDIFRKWCKQFVFSSQLWTDRQRLCHPIMFQDPVKKYPLAESLLTSCKTFVAGCWTWRKYNFLSKQNVSACFLQYSRTRTLSYFLVLCSRKLKSSICHSMKPIHFKFYWALLNFKFDSVLFYYWFLMVTSMFIPTVACIFISHFDGQIF